MKKLLYNNLSEKIKFVLTLCFFGVVLSASSCNKEVNEPSQPNEIEEIIDNSTFSKQMDIYLLIGPSNKAGRADNE